MFPQWNTLSGQWIPAWNKPFRCLQCPPDFQLVSKETCCVPESIHQIRTERKQCENRRLSVEMCRQVITEKVSLALQLWGQKHTALSLKRIPPPTSTYTPFPLHSVSLHIPSAFRTEVYRCGAIAYCATCSMSTSTKEWHWSMCSKALVGHRAVDNRMQQNKVCWPSFSEHVMNMRWVGHVIIDDHYYCTKIEACRTVPKKAVGPLLLSKAGISWSTSSMMVQSVQETRSVNSCILLQTVNSSCVLWYISLDDS